MHTKDHRNRSETAPTLESCKFFGQTTSALVASAMLIAGGAAFSGCSQYKDTPGFDQKTEFGRTVNSLAAVVGGIIAQKTATNAAVNLTVEKTLWPDAKLSGRTTATNIDTTVDLTLSSAHFTATGRAGSMKGEVAKSEFNWSVKQVDANTWAIGRFALKPDTTLSLFAANGVIKGEYNRPLAFNWKIHGRYDASGKVNVKISTGPATPNFSLRGAVIPTAK